MGMRWDVQDQVMAAQSVTTGTVVSSDSRFLSRNGGGKIDPSIGRRMCMLFMPSSEPAGDVKATSYRLDAIQADDTTFATNKEVLSSVTVTVASYAKLKGKAFAVPFPQGSITRQYIGGQVVVTGGTNPTSAWDVYYVPEDEVPVNTFFPKINEAQV